MSWAADSLGVVLAVVAMAGVPVVLVRAILGRADLACLYRAEPDAWPRGVQEEEARPWRFAPPGPARSRPVGPDDAYAVRPGPLARVRIGRPERASP